MASFEDTKITSTTSVIEELKPNNFLASSSCIATTITGKGVTSTTSSTSDLLVDKLVGPFSIEDSKDVLPATSLTSNKYIGSRSSSLTGTMFSDVFDGKGGELDSGPLEDSTGSASDGSDKTCKICNARFVSPRVLSCLHVFCENCLKKLLIDDSMASSASSTSSNGDPITPPLKSAIECPTCKQVTTVGPKGVESLMFDYIQTNILDLSTIEAEQLNCTSCKSKENAISRCSECANFLCGGCDKAHKYMRCFENHEVVKLEDMQKSGSEKPLTVHKPLFCSNHTTENLKYYCFNCQIPLCNECLIGDTHKGSEHHYDLLGIADKIVREDVENLKKEAQSKVPYCDSSAANLSSALSELQNQHDIARDVIQDTYEKCKAFLQECREKAMSELSKLHSERELKIMDLLQNLENTTGRIESTNKFTKRVLDQANAAEFLSLKKLISSQYINLINNMPKCNINYSLTFDTKPEKFEHFALELFGSFRTESTPPSPKESTPPPTLPGMPPMMNGRNHMNNSNNSQSQLASSVTASSPISLPTSMQSSFEGELSGIGNGFILPNVLTPDSPPQSATSLHHQLHSQNMHSHGNVNGFNGIGNGIGSGVNNNLNGLIGNNGLNSVNTNLSNAPLNNALNSQLGQGINTINAGLNAGINGGLNSLSNNMNVNLNSNCSGNGGGPQSYNSIVEYNLSRLARLTENTNEPLSDALVGNGAGQGVHHQSVVPSSTQNQPITLADILSGDQRALNNLQALAKLGMTNTDFCLPPATSPSLPPLSSIGTNVEDMTITNFHAGAGNNSTTNIVTGRNKATPMQIRCKFGSLGTSRGQFNSPHGFCLGVDEEIIVADTNNHRIEVFDKTGALKFNFGVPGKEEGQLWYPRKVAVMHTNGKFVVCDRGNERSRMQIFSKCGHFMRKIAIRYIDIVAGLAVTSKGHIVAVDSVSPTVFVISEEGELVRWFDCSDYMREPSDIAIRDNDFYVCDFKGHCVAVFQEDGTFQYRIGNEKVTCFPNGIDISNAGDILIGDSHGNRFHVACYSRDGVLQSEFECPHVKVSRCCGLKITSEGYVVTLAKNNHHVLVLNTLYVH
ncbi:brain tumor protein isoform X2 [Teleopsis dalmanni]|uniref:brain tumor protein isoform X2 n=1 Tax=Teleopsis dalmanni TaxID=139649 RepID=UPI0018CD9643|nr:brain tumor protein isoform X2 [Teleopsis dalmanni]